MAMLDARHMNIIYCLISKVMSIINNLVVAFALWALAFSLSFAYDPAPLQDLCVAINDLQSGVFVNGKFCKDPKLVTANDFFYSGFNNPGNTSNQLGVNVTLLSVDVIPGLNTNGLTIIRVDYAANGGLNPPHHHPRAAEVLTVLEGTLYAGFITSNPDHRLYTKTLHPGDALVFPFGLIHFQWNVGKTPAVAIAALSSQNPGVITAANTIFGANPPVDPRVIAKAFHLDMNLVANLQTQQWTNPT